MRVRPPQEFLDKLGNQPSGLLERSQGQLPDIQEVSQDASPGHQERSEARLLPPKKYRYLLEVKLPYDPVCLSFHAPIGELYISLPMNWPSLLIDDKPAVFFHKPFIVVVENFI